MDELTRRAAAVRLFVLDVDGVLTDGRLFIDGDGGETKAFDVRDGLAIGLAQRAGLRFAILSGRRAEAVTRRAAELGIEEVHQKIADKGACFEGILERNGVTADQVCFVGDDLIDLPVMRRVGLAAAPADAVREVLAVAHFVSSRPGGRGAVRETVELVLRSGGHWQNVTAPYFDGNRS